MAALPAFRFPAELEGPAAERQPRLAQAAGLTAAHDLAAGLQCVNLRSPPSSPQPRAARMRTRKRRLRADATQSQSTLLFSRSRCA